MRRMVQEEQQEESYKKCLRCGRTLKSKESQELGYGNYCYKHIKDKKKKNKKLFHV